SRPRESADAILPLPPGDGGVRGNFQRPAASSHARSSRSRTPSPSGNALPARLCLAPGSKERKTSSGKRDDLCLVLARSPDAGCCGAPLLWPPRASPRVLGTAYWVLCTAYLLSLRHQGQAISDTDMSPMSAAPNDSLWHPGARVPSPAPSSPLRFWHGLPTRCGTPPSAGRPCYGD